jgi:Fur family zinc uptake transcriptional regulator
MHDSLDTSGVLSKAERVCEEQGLALTPIRRRVLELLLEAGGPVKAYDLLATLKPGGAAQPPTVYRALDFLTAAGLVHKIEALNAYTACVHDHCGNRVELYVCESCGGVQESHIAANTIAMPDGFSLQRSVIEHYGLCAQCTG